MQDSLRVRFRVRAMEVWTPRVGTKAAALWISVAFQLAWVPALCLVFLPLIIAGSYTRIPALWLGGLVVCLVEVCLLVRMQFELRAFRRAASRTLGVRVGWMGPPSKEDKYIEWCRSKGIEPFQAMK
jgi:hypothetical protein